MLLDENNYKEQIHAFTQRLEAINRIDSKS